MRKITTLPCCVLLCSLNMSTNVRVEWQNYFEYNSKITYIYYFVTIYFYMYVIITYKHTFTHTQVQYVYFPEDTFLAIKDSYSITILVNRR